MTPGDLKGRTKAFGLRVCRLVDALPAFGLQLTGLPELFAVDDQPAADLEGERSRNGFLGHGVCLDPSMHDHLGIGGDRLRHRNPRRERGQLEPEDVVVPERRVTIEHQRLHSERSV